MKNAEKFLNEFGIYATELWAKPEKAFLEWLNADVPDTNVGDTISRQAAIDAIIKTDFMIYKGMAAVGRRNYMTKEEVRKIIEGLPSVQPERKWGKWETACLDHEAFGVRPKIFYCSSCNLSSAFPTNFCPNCGSYNRCED